METADAAHIIAFFLWRKILVSFDVLVVHGKPSSLGQVTADSTMAALSCQPCLILFLRDPVLGPQVPVSGRHELVEPMPLSGRAVTGPAIALWASLR